VVSESSVTATLARLARPAEVVFALAGSPPQVGCLDLDAPQRCRVCASETSRAAPYERWQGANFTDQNKLRYISGTVVCEPCVWAHAWNAPPGAPPTPGRKGLNLRLFSHLCDARGYRYANKAEKAEIRAWLCAPKVPPWWCAIADTGQKHVLLHTPVNIDPLVGAVRFEERDVFLDARITGEWCAATGALLTAGATKAEIEAGEYRPQTWLRCEARIRAYEALHRAERGGGWMALVIWLSQRDEDDVAARLAAEKTAKEAKADGRGTKRQGARRRSGSAARGEGGVPGERCERAQALAAAPGPGAACDSDERADHGVGDDAPQGAPARGPEQLGIPGCDRPVRRGRRR